MKFHFEPNLDYQLQAIEAVCDLFRGQEVCRTVAEAIREALQEAGIPFVTVAGRGFYDRPEIRDLVNVLRTLADPLDDLAFAGLLRSPEDARLHNALAMRLLGCGAFEEGFAEYAWRHHALSGLAVAPDGTALFANKVLARMLGVPLEQFVGRPFAPHVHPDHRQELVNLLDTARQGPTEAQLVLAGQDGKSIPVHAWASLKD